MTTILQKADLAGSSFTNTNTLAAGGIKVNTDAGSDVKTAIDAAVSAGIGGGASPTGAAGGNLAGTYPNPTFSAAGDSAINALIAAAPARSASSVPASGITAGAIGAGVTLSAGQLTGTISPTNLPNGWDNVDTFATSSAFPSTGAADVIYIAEDTNHIWRWTGSSYVDLTAAGNTGVATSVPASGVTAGALGADVTTTPASIVGFDAAVEAAVPDATASVKGKASIATQAEVDAGLDSTKIVVPATLLQKIKATQGNFSDEVTYNSAQAFSLADIGKAIVIKGGVGGTFTLPLASAVPLGVHFNVFTDTVPIIISPSAGEGIDTGYTGGTTSVTIKNKGTFTLTAVPGGWNIDTAGGVLDGAGAFEILAEGANYIAYRLPNGVIEQRGTSRLFMPPTFTGPAITSAETLSNFVTGTLSFPVAFPNKCLSFSLSGSGGSNGFAQAQEGFFSTYETPSTTGATVAYTQIYGSGSAEFADYMWAATGS